MNAVKTEQRDTMRVVNRILYTAFAVLSLYYLIRGSYGESASTLGIALIFDPFAPAKWEQRKIWQKAWLLIHVTLVITMFAVTFFLK